MARKGFQDGVLCERVLGFFIAEVVGWYSVFHSNVVGPVYGLVASVYGLVVCGLEEVKVVYYH